MKDSSISEKRVKVTEKKTLEWAQELIDMINEMSVKKQEGKEDELNDLEELFAKKVEAKYDELEKIAETLKPNKEEPFDRTNIPDAGEVLIEKDMIMLKIINEKERDDYLEVSYECSPMKNTFLNE